MSARQSLPRPCRVRALLTGVLLVLLPPCVHAQALRPTVQAAPALAPIEVDGALTETAWQEVIPAASFRQIEPDEGEPATQRTEVRFLYDEEALYVGARMYDTEGASGVVSRLFRRDGDFECDLLQIVFDTFHDHLGRTTFIVNPAGVKGDQLGLGGANPDESWDPVWDVATAIDSLGWTAELRIPFSQLRFSRGTDQTWGLQILRGVQRLNEISMWSFVPSIETGGPAFFGHLAGLTIGATPARGEILPYVVGRDARLGTADATSPFYHANDTDAQVGADFKYLLTSNLTLTGTV
ncbi:MAG: carbohydrate binding family 9 domain-containing protein, partial [Gemmatimonadota bacterium]